jgi:hypothetical protein
MCRLSILRIETVDLRSGIGVAVVEWRLKLADLSRAPMSARDKPEGRRAICNQSIDIVIAP